MDQITEDLIVSCVLKTDWQPFSQRMLHRRPKPPRVKSCPRTLSTSREEKERPTTRRAPPAERPRQSLGEPRTEDRGGEWRL